MALSKDVVIRLLGDSASAEKAIKAAADAAEVSVSAYKKAERAQAQQEAAERNALEARRAAMKEAGQTALILGGAMLAGFGIAAKAAMDFDRSMSAVGAATMANAEQMGHLRQAALDAGAATMYSAKEAADAETELAKAGISVKDILGGGLKGALDLAAAGQLAVADAAGIAATAMQQFHLSGTQTSHVADLLAAGAGKALGSVQDLSEGLKYVGPVAAGMGVSIEQTTGALALFASQGILGEQAGTSLRGVISALSSPSEQAAKQMEALGIHVFDAQGKFLGLDGIAGQLKSSMAGLTQEERSEALGRIFGNAQLTAAQVLYSAGAEGVDKWTKAVNDSGYAQRQAAKLTDNLAGDLERLGGSISTVLIGGGSQATGVLRWLVQAAESGVNAFGSLPAPLQAASFGFLGVVGAGTALLGIVGTMIPRIAEAREALRGLGTAGAMADAGLGKIGKIAGYGAAAAAGIGLIAAVTDALTPHTEVTTTAVEKLSASLIKLGETGYVTGEAQRLFGNNLTLLIGDMSATAPKIHGLGNEFLYLSGVIDESGNWDFSDVFRDGFGDIDRMNAAFKQAQQNVKDADAAMSSLVGSGHAEAAANAALQMFDAWTAAGGEIGTFREKFPDTVAALENYSTTSQTVVTQTGEIKNGMGEAASAADILKGAIDALNGVQLDQAEANIQWTQTLADIKIAAENGSISLDLNTKAGADNAEQFVTAAQRASEFAQTIANTQGLDAGRAALGTFRDALIDQAVKAGFSRDSVIGLIDQILRVPADTPTAINLHDNATPGIGAVNSALDNINGKTSTVYVKTVTTEVVNKILNAVPYNEAPSGGNPIGLPPVPHRAAGGSVWAGTFLVGEKGPEIVRFGQAGYVTPADQTAQILSALRQPAASGPALGFAAAGAAGGGSSSTSYSRTFAPVFQVAAARPMTARQLMDIARDEEFLHG